MMISKALNFLHRVCKTSKLVTFTGCFNQSKTLLIALYKYRFINWQAAAIRKTDPQALVTAGSWNPKSNTNMNGMKNLYSDHCLIRAGHDNAVSL